MSGQLQTFEVGDRIRIEATASSGGIVVSVGPAGVVEVTLEDPSGYVVEHRGELITVTPERGRLRRRGASDIHLRVPAAVSLGLKTASGDVMVNVPVREVEVSTASGDIRLGSAARLKAQSGSGDVHIDAVETLAEVNTGSGEVRIGVVEHDLQVNTASGDVDVDRIGRTAGLKSASGDLTVRRFDGTDLRLNTLSGDARVGVPPHRVLDCDLQTLSGELRNRLPTGDGSEPELQVSLRIKTMSGDVTLEGA